MSTRNHITWLIALCLILIGTSIASARTPMRRIARIRTRGAARPSIAVPYLTNSRSNFGVWNGVAPKIYAAPVVNQPSNPGARPVYNLPFYGAKMGFSGRANGAVTRKSLVPQPIFR